MDTLGNLIAFKKGSADAATRRRIMLSAHMDEVGFMITHHDGDGLFRFFVWDQEIVMDFQFRNRINVSNNNSPAYVYAALRKNAEFTQRNLVDFLKSK